MAAKFGVTLSGVADDITDEIGGAGWKALQDGAAAGAAAAQGSLVIGAQSETTLKGDKENPIPIKQDFSGIPDALVTAIAKAIKESA